MSSGDDNGNHGPVGRGAYWLSWMLGAAILVAVVVAALHVAEGRELIDVARRAKPWWLVPRVPPGRHVTWRRGRFSVECRAPPVTGCH